MHLWVSIPFVPSFFLNVTSATRLTQALLQVLASYSMQRFLQPPCLISHSHALNSHSHPMADLTPIPMGIPLGPMGSQSSTFPCTPLVPIGAVQIQDKQQQRLFFLAAKGQDGIKSPYLCDRLTDFDEIW